MLGQIVSNAIKYSSDSPMLTISMIHSEIADVLSVEDNGIGVKKYDLPYIFQKGFTGDFTDSRKKATGIGPVSYTHLDVYKRQVVFWGKHLSHIPLYIIIVAYRIPPAKTLTVSPKIKRIFIVNNI